MILIADEVPLSNYIYWRCVSTRLLIVTGI